jgi:hypothetical protein
MVQATSVDRVDPAGLSSTGYEFYELEILGRPCLAMVDRVDEEISPTTIRKHAEYLVAKFPGDVIYVRQQLAAYQRK